MPGESHGFYDLTQQLEGIKPLFRSSTSVGVGWWLHPIGGRLTDAVGETQLKPKCWIFLYRFLTSRPRGHRQSCFEMFYSQVILGIVRLQGGLSGKDAWKVEDDGESQIQHVKAGQTSEFTVLQVKTS